MLNLSWKMLSVFSLPAEELWDEYSTCEIELYIYNVLYNLDTITCDDLCILATISH